MAHMNYRQCKGQQVHIQDEHRVVYHRAPVGWLAAYLIKRKLPFKGWGCGEGSVRSVAANVDASNMALPFQVGGVSG